MFRDVEDGLEPRDAKSLDHQLAAEIALTQPAQHTTGLGHRRSQTGEQRAAGDRAVFLEFLVALANVGLASQA